MATNGRGHAHGRFGYQVRCEGFEPADGAAHLEAIWAGGFRSKPLSGHFLASSGTLYPVDWTKHYRKLSAPLSFSASAWPIITITLSSDQRSNPPPPPGGDCNIWNDGAS